MPIVPSRAKQIQELLARLGRGSDAEREGAIARLTLLGPRAVEPILGSLRAADARSRLAMLEVLERLHDPRALPEILTLARASEPDVARKAIGLAADYPQPRTVATLAKVLGGGPPELRAAAVTSLARLHASGVVEALDPLLDLLLDEEEDDDALRGSVLECLAGLPASALLPILDQLRGTASAALAARAGALRQSLGGRKASPEALSRKVSRLLSTAGPGVEGARSELDSLGLPALDALLERLEGTTRPADAERIGGTLTRFGEAGLGSLHRALEATTNRLALSAIARALADLRALGSIPLLHRALEAMGTRFPRAGEAALAKAEIHRALAAFDTRIALYDLREMLSARPCLATAELLEVAARLGEASLVPAVAALAHDEPSAFDGCAAALGAIARREKLRRAGAARRAVKAEHRRTLDRLWSRRSR